MNTTQKTENIAHKTAHQTAYKKCHHCEGKGYIEIRDCSAEVQREETCSFCQGTGEIEIINPEKNQPENF
ncbi:MULTISPECIES: hypothetical protein [Planktothricoides]|uniref:Molecular chaperone DnaJ n=1 Tax=Planktothricoides raciborskii GIHE-MW2 TaxID=2792601 RepID=A0AAU8JK67_9CYAN|nr:MULTISPECIES: hypothetical protein [Planktothricoides]